MDTNLKRFTLTATASALLALHGEIAKAAPCPPEIAIDLGGQVCQMTTSTVTVENGGAVGGIELNAGTGSQITVNAGGDISGGTGTGINVNTSTLTNGILNNGTISAATNGIFISNSTVGDIVNNGIIDAGATGININSSTINGSITNNGTISGGSIDSGVTIRHSTMNGDFTNTGTINSGPSAGNGVLIQDSDVLNGSFINSGTINAGNAGVDISNSSHVTGDIFNSGSIFGGTNGVEVSHATQVDGSLLNSGLIHGDQVGVAVFSASTLGGISNSGTISGGQTGILVQFTATLNGGISDSGTIEGGTYAIFISPDSNVTGGINIVGQHARIIGEVYAPNTDFNITSGAIFTSEGDFNVQNFNIASNAIFYMNNTITASGAVNNAGTLSVGNKVETINTGGYTQNTGGTFQTELTSGSAYGQLLVGGAVDLSQSGNINVKLDSNSAIHSGEIFSNIIRSETSLTGPTNGFNVTDNSFLWQFIASLNNNSGVDLTAEINPSAYNVCQGIYCQGAANVIIGQVAAGNPAFDAYNALATGEAFKTAASQATPELINENVQTIQLLTRSVMDILPMWSALRDESIGGAMLYQPGKVWVKPYGFDMTQNENNTVPGFNTTAYGFVVGSDTQLTDNGLLGAAIAAGKDNMQGNSVLNTQSISSDAYQGILYGSKEFSNHLYFAGQGLLGYQSNDANRGIPLYATTAKGSYGSWFTNFRTELGLNFLPTNYLTLTPNIEASYLFVNQDGYQESGSPMDLSIDSNNNSSFVVGAYGNGTYHLATFDNQQELSATGYVGVARNILNSQTQTVATFLAGGPSFATPGAQFNSCVFRGGLGLAIAGSSKPLALHLNYDFQNGNNAYSNMGSVTLTYKI